MELGAFTLYIFPSVVLNGLVLYPAEISKEGNMYYIKSQRYQSPLIILLLLNYSNSVRIFFFFLQSEIHMSEEAIQDILEQTESDPAFQALFDLFDYGK